MSYSIWIKRETQLDIDQAVIWYETQKLNLGLDLRFELDKVINKIAANPYYAWCIFEDTRAASLKTFPYEIVYRIYEDEKRVNIIALSHQHRKPHWYKDRK